MTRKSLSRPLCGLAAGLLLAAVPGLVSPAQAQAKPTFLYDWSMLSMGQQLWEEELLCTKSSRRCRAPETSNLTGILDAMKKAGHPNG